MRTKEELKDPNNGIHETTEEVVQAAEEAERFSHSQNRFQKLGEELRQREMPMREHLSEAEELLIDAYESGDGIAYVQAETGAGKSVLLPSAMQSAQFKLGLPKRMLILQPRKDAASDTSLAIAAINNMSYGTHGQVGFSTSENKMISNENEISVVTPGILLQYLLHGAIDNERFGGLIIDEAHEQSMDYHFIFLMLKRLKADGKLPLTLFTSATLDHAGLSEYMGNSDSKPLEVEGRTFPVEETELEIRNKKVGESEREYLAFSTAESIRQALDANMLPPDGDILIFLPGKGEIELCIETTKKLIGNKTNFKLLPLHGSLAVEDRKMVREPHNDDQRRIIFATNIAETSLTIPGVKAVIDTCVRRAAVYDPETGVTNMKNIVISKRESEQRRGRAGRVCPGVSFKLLQQDAKQREMPTSEMSLANLSNVIMKILAYDMDVDLNDFIDAPDHERVEAGYNELQELGIIDENHHLTDKGREIIEDKALRDFEPRIAVMMLEALKQMDLAKDQEPSDSEKEPGVDWLVGGLITASIMHLNQNIFNGPSDKMLVEASGNDSNERKINARNALAQKQRALIIGINPNLVGTDPTEGSDWIQIIRTIYAGLRNGLYLFAFGDPQFQRADPTGYRDRHRQFEKWCEENRINKFGLAKLLQSIFDYADHLKIELFDEDLKNLKDLDREIISHLLLNAYPDHLGLTAISSARYMPYISVGRTRTPNNLGNYREAFSLSPGSSQFSAEQPIVIYNNQTHSNDRTYAHLIHSVSIDRVGAVYPDMVRESISDYARPTLHDDGTLTGKTSTNLFHPVTRDSLGGIPNVTEQNLHGEPFQDFIYKKLVGYGLGLDELPPVFREVFEANKQTFENLAKVSAGLPLAQRVEFSYRNWIKERLVLFGDISNISEVVARIDELRLNASEVLAPEIIEGYNRSHPAHINAYGRMLGPINYRRTSFPDEERATIELQVGDFNNPLLEAHIRRELEGGPDRIMFNYNYGSYPSFRDYHHQVEKSHVDSVEQLFKADPANEATDISDPTTLKEREPKVIGIYPSQPNRHILAYPSTFDTYVRGQKTSYTVDLDEAVNNLNECLRRMYDSKFHLHPPIITQTGIIEKLDEIDRTGSELLTFGDQNRFDEYWQQIEAIKADYYDLARDLAFLNYSAQTDMDRELLEVEFQEIQEDLENKIAPNTSVRYLYNLAQHLYQEIPNSINSTFASKVLGNIVLGDGMRLVMDLLAEKQGSSVILRPTVQLVFEFLKEVSKYLGLEPIRELDLYFAESTSQRGTRNRELEQAVVTRPEPVRIYESTTTYGSYRPSARPASTPEPKKPTTLGDIMSDRLKALLEPETTPTAAIKTPETPSTPTPVPETEPIKPNPEIVQENKLAERTAENIQFIRDHLEIYITLIYRFFNNQDLDTKNLIRECRDVQKSLENEEAAWQTTTADFETIKRKFEGRCRKELAWLKALPDRIIKLFNENQTINEWIVELELERNKVLDGILTTLKLYLKPEMSEDELVQALEKGLEA